MAKTSGGVRRAGKQRPGVAAEAREKILTVLKDIGEKGYSTEKPFIIGKVEKRMLEFAEKNGIKLAGKHIYMASDSIAHAMRDAKAEKGLAVSHGQLSKFPIRLSKMSLYYDTRTGNFTYTDGHAKYIINPNYERKINRKKKNVVDFITASKIKNMQEFVMQKYIKIEDI